tara:strand:- start:1667 stop:2008 length:342 start_codon:yes stop_codon:yes gene_type:complete
MLLYLDIDINFINARETTITWKLSEIIYFECVYYIMAVREMSPAQKEELKKQRQEYCKKNPDTEGCEDVEDVEEGELESAIAKMGGMTLLISCLSSSAMITIVVILMMTMRKK